MIDENWEDGDFLDETWTERLRRRVQQFHNNRGPYGQAGNEVIEWLALLPVKVREAIFLILDGYHRQKHRAALKGARTRRAPKGEA